MDLDRSRYAPQLELMRKPNWSTCTYCSNARFKLLEHFTRHLRSEHCTVEGGSFVCRYGYNSVCNSLPVEGVSDLDYADHIIKQHAFASINSENNNMRRKQSTSSDKSMTSIASGSSEPSSAWMAVSASQNLAAVLNDPGRGKQRDFFTRLWGVDFVEIPLTNIPPNPHLPLVTRAHFETYLRKISKRHRRHEQLHAALPGSAAFPSQRRAAAAAVARSIERRMEPLDVPPIFLQTDFELSRPDVFYTALPFAKAGITVNGPFRQSGKMLQEKLTQSLDQVEMRIAEQVADKSEAFFAAMTSHDTLMAQLAKTLAVVRGLRTRIADVDSTVACQALRTLRLQQRRSNHLQVLLKLRVMRTVHQTQPQIQLLLSAPDYVAALELISSSKHLLDHELATVHSFRHLAPQLAEMTRLIDKMMASEFQGYSTRDLNRVLTDNLEVLEQDKLVCIMLGMLRRGSSTFIGQYEAEALTTVKTLVKQIVLEQLADADCESHGPLAERAQALPLPHFLQLMDTATEQVARLLRKIKGVHDVMKQTIDMAAGDVAGDGDGFSFLEPKHHEKAHAELRRLLTAVCSYAHEECGKLLGHVAALDAASASQVCRLGQVVERFSKECAESGGGRGPAALRAAFQVAAGRFVSRFHQERKERLTVQLDAEMWRPVDVPPAAQRFVAATSESDGGIPDWPDLPPGPNEPCLLVGKERFIVVGSALAMVRLVAEYSAVAGVLSLLAPHLLRDLAELLLLFNSRSCQLVLGAKALQTAGLSTITTANLVLTSRALQLMLWFLPHIRRHFEVVTSESSQRNGKVPGANLLDDVESHMVDHVAELHGKVVLVVSSVVTNELSSWAVKPPVPSQAFRNVSRHLTKLHDAVSGVLPANQVDKLYRNIHNKFKSGLREQLKKLNIVNNGGPQHGTVTSELIFYVEMLKKLNVLPSQELSESSLAEIWLPKSN